MDSDEIDRLRARLAEVEARHTSAANLWAHEVAKVAEERERAEAAEAALAQCRAERDQLAANNDVLAKAWRDAQGETDVALHDGDLLRARLSAVLALCDDRDPELTFLAWQQAVRTAAGDDRERE